MADNEAAPTRVLLQTKIENLGKSPATESEYSIAELVGATQKFGTKPECIYAALKEKQKSTFTFTEAKQIINQFLKREVKK